MTKVKTNFEGQTVFVGMDIHKSSWNLGIYLGDMYVKNVHQKPNPHIMTQYLRHHYPGARYVAAYEAGKFGFWIQRQLGIYGIDCLIVNPADIPKSQKDSLQKTDPRDARNLGLRLQSNAFSQLIKLWLQLALSYCSGISIPLKASTPLILFLHRVRSFHILLRWRKKIRSASCCSSGI